MGAKKRVVPNPATGKPSDSSQLWLSLIEDASKVEWPPTLKHQNWRVRLSKCSSLQECEHRGLYRTSPVFPLTPNFKIPDLSAGVYYFCFFCFDPAFPILGRLLQSTSKELADSVLYTNGLASILLVTKNVKLSKKLERIAEERLSAKETWEVDQGQIKLISCQSFSTVKLDYKHLQVRQYDSLPLVARTTVDEFVANMAILVPKVALHIPSETETFIRLVRLVNELVTEMVYVTNPIGNPPATLEEYTREQFTASASLCNRILHQDTDRLIQINSALSYVSTQALSGAIPILDRRSLIRRYSLLGIGTATLALTRTAHWIERAFAKGALEDILDEKAGSAAALPGLDTLPEYDARRWEEFSIDRLKGKIQAREPFPKLPYFSGRLGFREAEYTVSAALQAVVAGAGPEWSLLILTHEMVHGHVRNLLSMIFQGNPNRPPDEKWNDFYQRFKARCKGNPSDRESLLDSLRAVVLAYCCNALTHGSLTAASPEKPGKHQDLPLQFNLPTPESLWVAYETEHRNISEIFVHVLDLHYFYRSCLTQYLPLIWRSWSTIPQVWADLRQYMLRSLLVIATKTEGTAYERFNLARSRFAELLDTLQNEEGGRAPVIGQALKRVTGDYAEKHLFYPFSASLILVDLVHHVLTSNTIRGALNAGDTHFKVAPTTSYEEWLLYDMPEEFVDDVVISPTAYLADRLSRTMKEDQTHILESKTAALFLACASNVNKGAPNA